MTETQISRGFRCLGDVNKFAELKAIYQAIVHQEAEARLPSGAKVRTKVMGHPRKLYAIDYNGIRYVQQNTSTNSQYALRARRGAKIVWIIRLKDNQYLGYCENGITYRKGETP